MTSTPTASSFRFAKVSLSALGSTAHVVPVAAGLRRKHALLACYQRALRLPDYFGWNWDALEECLGDLSWLAAPRRVVVVHADVPFAPAGKNRPAYLALLADLVAASAALEVVFPPAAKAEIASALARREE